MRQFINRLSDGTVKQINPFSGTEVWTVPGRGHRPLPNQAPSPEPVDSQQIGWHCAFCERRYLETPPEKSRLIRKGDNWHKLDAVSAEHLHQEPAEFRRIPNLFEVLPLTYWNTNYDYQAPAELLERRNRYASTVDGRAHLRSIVGAKLRAAGASDAECATLTDQAIAEIALGFFASSHDVIVARNHFTPGATESSQLASSGTLTPSEHRAFIGFTVDALQDLYKHNRYARYVAVFQNWLRPAGASFDHLHKQLAAIDERGHQIENTLAALRQNPNLFNEVGVNYAHYNNLMIAANEHAVAFAGFGHRYPTIEIYSRSQATLPFDHAPDEILAMSDLLHAMHAATGPTVACNEEWHHQPTDADRPMPWRIMLKWRISTLAGFEGGTKINLNTISPYRLRDSVVSRLFQLRESGAIADMQLATECDVPPNPLRYCT